MSRKPEAEYDVVVAGGGAGGVGAALGAARAGAKVLLVEKYGFLGGAATTSQVLAYCGFFQQGPEPVKAVGGVADLVLQELRRLGLGCEPFNTRASGNWIILLEPETVKLGLDRVLQAHGIEVLLHTMVSETLTERGTIQTVVLAGPEGKRTVDAAAFIDATGDAVLSTLAGLNCRVGDGEGRLQPVTAPLRIGGRDPQTPIDQAAVAAALEEYNRTGAYPTARTNGGYFAVVPITGDIWWSIIDLELPEISAESFTRAERIMRAAARDYLDVLRESVPGFENAYLVQTGPQIGIRESRHPPARYELTGEDLLIGRQRPDGVARAAWAIEDHSVIGKPVFQALGGDGYAHVPLDALRAKGLDNLYFAGRVIGADPVAYASIRVMGTAFATGEAAGVAAAIGPDAKAVRAHCGIV